MKRIGFSIIIVLLPIFLFSQDRNRIDSLTNILRGHIQDTARVKVLTQLAMEYMRSDTIVSWNYLERLHSIATNNSDAYALAVYYSTRGKILSYYGEYERALVLYQSANSHFLLSNSRIELANVIVDEGNAYLFLAEYHTALNKYKEALKIFFELSNYAGMSRCYNNMGIIYKNFGSYNEALESYQAVIDINKNPEDSGQLVDVYINMGVVHVLTGDYLQALEQFNKALLHAEESGNKKHQAICLINIGVVNNRTENYLLALDYYEKALIVARELNDKIEISKCLTNIGTNYISLEKYDLAENFIRRGLTIKEDLGDIRSISNCHGFLAEIEFYRGNYEASRELDKKAIVLKRIVSDYEGLSRVFNNMSRTSNGLGNYLQAITYTDSSLKYGLKVGALEPIEEAYLHKKVALENLDRYKEAYEMAELHKAYSDSLMNEEKARALHEIEYQYKTKALQDENSRLQLQSNIDKILISRHKKIIIFELLALVLVIFVIILLITIQRRQKHYNNNLEKKTQVITKQNVKLDTMNRTKDKILSVMTHDLRGTIGNQLTALSVLADDDFQSEEEKKVVFFRLANSATISLELLENLSIWTKIQEGRIRYVPEQDYLDQTFLDALDTYKESFSNKEIKLEHKVKDEFPCFYDHFMIKTVLKIFISNAIKFSMRGGLVKTGLNVDEDKVTVYVTDSGVGISEAEIKQLIEGQVLKMRRGTENEKGSGLGLLIAKNFLDQHGSGINIRSVKNGETTLSFSLPLVRPA